MGIYDRDYNRGNYDQPSGFSLGGSTTLTTKLVIVMFGVYVVQQLTRGQFPNDGWFTELFSLHADFPVHPWRFFELLTYGFLHDVWDLKHIIFNMITFWFFGRSIEYRYGEREYLIFFLVAIVAAGATWVLGVFVANHQWINNGSMLGASGGISAVLLLYCFNFPRNMIYVWGVLPIPAWVFAILFVGQDLFGASGRPFNGDMNVAYTAHLGGALFGFIYYQAGWRFERLLPSASLLKKLKPRPNLRVHDPDPSADSNEDSTEAQVDEILKKIQEHGRNSLTRQERRILEEASRKYQNRRH